MKKKDKVKVMEYKIYVYLIMFLESKDDTDDKIVKRKKNWDDQNLMTHYFTYTVKTFCQRSHVKTYYN